MSNIQLFSNNAKTTLAAQLLVGSTTFTVGAGGGALFRTIAAPNHELITLQRESDGAIEIVKVTSHLVANDIFAVVTRAQEGTIALQFEIGDKVQARWTRGTAEALTQGVPFTGVPGTLSIDMQASRSNPATVGVTGNNSVGIGREVTISTSSSVGIGSTINITGSNGVGIGYNATVGGAGGIAIGFSGVQANGNQSIAIGGSNLQASNYRAIAIGWDANIAANYAIAIGAGKFNAGVASVAIGNYGNSPYGYSVSVGSYAYTTQAGATALGNNSSAYFNGVAVGYNASTLVTGGVAVGRSATSNGTVSIAIGNNASATNARVTVVGYGSSHSGYYGVVLGAANTGLGAYAIAIGSAITTAAYVVAIGGRAVVSDIHSIAIGYDAQALNERTISIGSGSRNVGYGVTIGHAATTVGTSLFAISIGYSCNISNSTAAIAIGQGINIVARDHAIALGYEARPGTPDVAHIAAPIVVVADHAGVAFADAGERLRGFAGVEVVLLSKAYDLTDVTPFDGGTLGTKDFWVMPAGAKFYPDEVGIVTDTQNTVTTGPTASFGHGGAGTQILNNQLFASGVLGQSGGRGQYATAAPQGVGTVSIAMNGAATATALTGRFFVRGMMVENTS